MCGGAPNPFWEVRKGFPDKVNARPDFSISALVDILRQMILAVGVSAVEGIARCLQHPWPLPTRCRWYPLPSCDNLKCHQTWPNVLRRTSPPVEISDLD